MATATAVEGCALTRIAKRLMARMLQDEQGVAQLFVTRLLYRNIRYEADLVAPCVMLDCVTASRERWKAQHGVSHQAGNRA
jgi:hypothetical protein